MSEAQKRIDSLFNRLQSQRSHTNPVMSNSNNGGLPPSRPSLSCKYQKLGEVSYIINIMIFLFSRSQ